MSDVKTFKRPEGAAPAIKFVKAKDLAEQEFKGVVVEGEYVEAIPNNFDTDKSDYKFLTDNGEHVIVNGTGSLNREMDRIKPGTYCQVNYEGVKALTKGKFKGKNCHIFNVLVAE